jgi:hypothetical protein
VAGLEWTDCLPRCMLIAIQFESSGKWPDSNGLIASLVAC